MSEKQLPIPEQHPPLPYGMIRSIAKEVGITEGYLSRILNQGAMPSFELCVKLDATGKLEWNMVNRLRKTVKV